MGDGTNWTRTPLINSQQSCVPSLSEAPSLTPSSNLSGQVMSMLTSHPTPSANPFFGSSNHGSLFTPGGVNASTPASSLLNTGSQISSQGNPLQGTTEFPAPNSLMGAANGAMDPTSWGIPTTKSEVSTWSHHGHSFPHDNYR